MRLLGILFVLCAGALTTVEAGACSQLTKSLKEFWWPAVTFGAVSCLVLVTCALVARAPLPDRGVLATVPWWAWTGGLFGALYALAMVTMPDRLGSAIFTTLTVTAAVLCSLLLDHMGWLGFKEHPAGVGRAIGAVLMVAGLGCIAAF